MAVFPVLGRLRDGAEREIEGVLPIDGREPPLGRAPPPPLTLAPPPPPRAPPPPPPPRPPPPIPPRPHKIPEQARPKSKITAAESKSFFIAAPFMCMLCVGWGNDFAF